MEMPMGEYPWHLHKVSIRPVDDLMLNCTQESMSLANSRSRKAGPDFFREDFGHSSPVQSCWKSHRPVTNLSACNYGMGRDSRKSPKRSADTQGAPIVRFRAYDRQDGDCFVGKIGIGALDGWKRARICHNTQQ